MKTERNWIPNWLLFVAMRPAVVQAQITYTNELGYTITAGAITTTTGYIATNTLSDAGPSSFSDPDWTNSPGRFYRLRSP